MVKTRELTFHQIKKPMNDHLHWMTHTSTAQGELVVENDFDTELDGDSEQLTSNEIIAVNGDFAVGDTILVRKDDGTRLAKAKSNYSSCLLRVSSQSKMIKLLPVSFKIPLAQ